MKYKVICEVSLPQFEYTFDLNIPYNKTIYYVCKMLDKIIQENMNGTYQPNDSTNLINMRTGQIYDMNMLVSETDIRNGTRLTYY